MGLVIKEAGVSAQSGKRRILRIACLKMDELAFTISSELFGRTFGQVSEVPITSIKSVSRKRLRGYISFVVQGQGGEELAHFETYKPREWEMAFRSLNIDVTGDSDLLASNELADFGRKTYQTIILILMSIIGLATIIALLGLIRIHWFLQR